MATEYLIGLAPLAMNSISRVLDVALTGRRTSVSSSIFWVDQFPFDVRMRTTPTVKLMLRAMLEMESAVTTNSVASLLITICESTFTFTVGIVVEGLSSGASESLGSCVVVGGAGTVVVDVITGLMETMKLSVGAAAAEKLIVAGTAAYSVHVPEASTVRLPLKRSMVQMLVVEEACEISPSDAPALTRAAMVIPSKSVGSMVSIVVLCGNDSVREVAVSVALAVLVGIARVRCGFVGKIRSISQIPLRKKVAYERMPNGSFVGSPSEQTFGVRLTNRTSSFASVMSFFVPNGIEIVAQNEMVSPSIDDQVLASRGEVLAFFPETLMATRAINFVTTKLTLAVAAACVSVAAMDAVIVQVPAALRYPTRKTVFVADVVLRPVTFSAEQIFGVSVVHVTMPPPDDGVASSDGPMAKTGYDAAAPVMLSVRV